MQQATFNHQLRLMRHSTTDVVHFQFWRSSALLRHQGAEAATQPNDGDNIGFWHLGTRGKMNKAALGSAGWIRSQTGRKSQEFGAQTRPKTLANGSVSHILGSQAWNQPAKVGGSAPCLMVVMGSPLRPDGSEST